MTGNRKNELGMRSYGRVKYTSCVENRLKRRLEEISSKWVKLKIMKSS